MIPTPEAIARREKELGRKLTPEDLRVLVEDIWKEVQAGEGEAESRAKPKAVKRPRPRKKK